MSAVDARVAPPPNPRIPGVHSLRQIHQGSTSAVWRGQWDRGAVVARWSAVGNEHILELAARYPGAGLPTVYGAFQIDGVSYLLLEDLGEPLPRIVTVGGLRESLGRALALVQALARVHEAGLVHLNLEPSTVLLSEGRGALCGWRFARGVGETGPDPTPSPYSAPEQLHDRPADVATDLYRVGAVLCELFSGRAPAAGGAPNAFPPSTPPVVVEIVGRLLRRDPAERYPSARSLADDLEHCLASLQRLGNIPSFPLATRSRRVSYAPATGFYGQTGALARLRELLDRATTGEALAASIQAGSGEGKSRLLEEAFQKGPHLVATGKFENQGRLTPYLAVVRALRGAFEPILTGSDVGLADWQAELSVEIGSNTAPALALFPELNAVLPATPDVEVWSPGETALRTRTALLAILRSLARAGRPLVLVLDDLQWADRTSLELVEHLLTDWSLRATLLVLCWRSTEVGEDHPLTSILRRVPAGLVLPVTLDPWRPIDAAALVADSLGVSAADVMELADLLQARANGNPLFLQVLLGELHHRGLLRAAPDARRWEWSRAEIESTEVVDGVVGLLCERMRRRPMSEQRLLGRIALIGNAALPEPLLREIIQDGAVVSEEAVSELVTAGFLRRSRATLAFVHDQVRDAAASMLSPGEQKAFRSALGRTLLGRPDHVVLAATQYLEMDAVSPEETQVVAELWLEAARLGRTSGAFDEANRFALAGVRLLRDEGWGAAPELTVLLHLEAAECGLVAPQGADPFVLAKAVLARSTVTEHQLRARRILFDVHVARQENDEAIRVGSETLTRLGQDLPSRPGLLRGGIDLLAGMWGSRGLDAERVDALAVNVTPDHVHASRLLMELTRPAFLASNAIVLVVFSRALRRALSRGLCLESSFGVASFAILLVGAGFESRALTIGEAARAIVNRFRPERHWAPIEMVWHGFLHHLRAPIAEASEALWSASRAALQEGLAPWAGDCAFGAAECMVFAGMPLDRCEEGFLKMKRLARQVGQQAPVMRAMPHMQVIAHLRGRAVDGRVLRGEYLTDIEAWMRHQQDAKDTAAFYTLYDRMAHANLLLGFGEEAAANAIKALSRLTPGPDCHTSWFTSALAFYDAADRSTGLTRWRWLRRAGRAHARLAALARRNPHDDLPRLRIVEGAEALLRGKLAALALFEEAARLTRRTGNLMDESIALERATRGALRLGQLLSAQPLLRAAWDANERWGAHGRRPLLLALARELGVDDLDERPGAAQDRSPIVRAAELIATHAQTPELLRELLRLMVECSSATSGMLVRIEAGALVVATRCDRVLGGSDVPLVLTSPRQPVDTLLSGPTLSALQYCRRTRLPLLLSGDDRASRLLDGSGRTGSLLCHPMTKGAELVGVVVLEHATNPDAFPVSAQDWIRVVAGQAAAALESARLYENVQAALVRQTTQNEAFAHFMPPRFLELVGRTSIQEVELGDQVQRETTILFLDIRGYTTLVEELGPAGSFRLAKSFMQEMEPAILGHNGFVNQYMGDSIMAVFPGAAQDALLAALDMIDTLRRFNDQNRDAGQPELRVGIGMHSGLVTIGIIGGHVHRDRGMVGDAVNTASRIEGTTKMYGSTILISDVTAARLEPGRFSLRTLDVVLPVGKARPLTLVEVLDAEPEGVRDARVATAARFQEARALYTAGDFTGAASAFAALHAEDPEDGSVALYVRRCEAFRVRPPEGWDGVSRLEFK